MVGVLHRLGLSDLVILVFIDAVIDALVTTAAEAPLQTLLVAVS